VTLRAERPVEVLADASQLRQVLDNLLGNVRSHTPQGTATIVSVDEEEGDAVVRVADQGRASPMRTAPGFSSASTGRIHHGRGATGAPASASPSLPPW